jgi:hypothetical protein
MKSQSFPFLMIFGTTSLCAVFLLWSGSIGLAAESGLDTAKIESITGLKGVRNEKEIRTANAQPTKSFGLGQLPEKSSIDGEAISQVFGQKGDANNGMYKVTIGREVEMDGHKVGNTMGVNTWAAFAGTPDNALVVGDFAVLENELQTVLKTLRGANINIVAIHQHMTGENPRMIFLHYYGRGKALALAQGVKAAINTPVLSSDLKLLPKALKNSRFSSCGDPTEEIGIDMLFRGQDTSNNDCRRKLLLY